MTGGASRSSRTRPRRSPALPKFKELLAAIQAAQRLFNEVANLPGGKFLTLPDVSSYRRGKKGEDGEHADRFVHEGIERALHQVKTAAPKHTVCPYQFNDIPHQKECRTCRGLNWDADPLGQHPARVRQAGEGQFRREGW